MNLHIKIQDIDDDSLSSLVDEILEQLRHRREEYFTMSLHSFLALTISQELRGQITQQHCRPGVLTTRVGKMRGTLLFDYCAELARLKGFLLKGDENKTVLSLMKKCFPKFNFAKSRPINRKVEAMTRIIVQRRRNGSL